MRISIRMKMFALVALVLILSISAVIWKTSGTFREDKALFVKEFADRFTGTIARLTINRVQNLQNNTAVFVSNRESLKNIKTQQNIGKILFERFSEAFVVAVVDKSSGKWAPQWVEKNAQSFAAAWPSGYETTIVKSLNYDATQEAGLFLTKLSQPNGQAIYAIAFVADLQSDTGASSSKSILVSIVSPIAFEDIIKDFKGDINEVMIIDQRGYVYAHPDPQYMNKNLEAHPLVAEIRELNKEGATGFYSDLEGQSIIGSYRKVKSTNLYVVVSTPTKTAFKAAEILIRSVIVFGVGFGLIGIVIAIFVAGRITKPLHRLQVIAEKIGLGDFKILVDVSSNDEVGALAKSIDTMKSSLLEREEALEHSKMALIQSEKMSAFGQLSAGIAHEVKNPLAGILGHAQLAKGKTQDPDMKKHIEIIEKETRRTKEIIENLMKFARAEKAELTPTNLYETVNSTCDLVDHQLTLMGVKITKKLNTVQKVNANSNQLQQVFLNIMMNAGHAMEKSSVKELTVYLEEAKDCVRVRIQDTGSGMSPEVQKRIFEPFFTTKPAGKGTGLGLSVTIGIVRDHNAKIYVQSEIGKGTVFFIDFPLLTKDAGKTAPTTSAETSAPTVASATPPPLPKTDLPSKSPDITLTNLTKTEVSVKSSSGVTPPGMPKPPPTPRGEDTAITKSIPPKADTATFTKSSSSPKMDTTTVSKSIPDARVEAAKTNEKSFTEKTESSFPQSPPKSTLTAKDETASLTKTSLEKTEKTEKTQKTESSSLLKSPMPEKTEISFPKSPFSKLKKIDVEESSKERVAENPANKLAKTTGDKSSEKLPEKPPEKKENPTLKSPLPEKTAISFPKSPLDSKNETPTTSKSTSPEKDLGATSKPLPSQPWAKSESVAPANPKVEVSSSEVTSVTTTKTMLTEKLVTTPLNNIPESPFSKKSETTSVTASTTIKSPEPPKNNLPPEPPKNLARKPLDVKLAAKKLPSAAIPNEGTNTKNLPPTPSAEELGYNLHNGTEEFKVNIRRPKLRV